MRYGIRSILYLGVLKCLYAFIIYVAVRVRLLVVFVLLLHAGMQRAVSQWSSVFLLFIHLPSPIFFIHCSFVRSMD